MKQKKSAHSWAIGFVLTLVTAVCTVHADEDKMLIAAEITEMVTGNTMSGVFGEDKTRYAQRNHCNGIAVVHIDGSPIRHIPWFVEAPDSYCEDWAEFGVLCFKVGQNTSTGERYFVRLDGTITKTTVQEGFHSINFE